MCDKHVERGGPGRGSKTKSERRARACDIWVGGGHNSALARVVTWWVSPSYLLTLQRPYLFR